MVINHWEGFNFSKNFTWKVARNAKKTFVKVVRFPNFSQGFEPEYE